MRKGAKAGVWGQEGKSDGREGKSNSRECMLSQRRWWRCFTQLAGSAVLGPPAPSATLPVMCPVPCACTAAKRPGPLLRKTPACRTACCVAAQVRGRGRGTGRGPRATRVRQRAVRETAGLRFPHRAPARPAGLVRCPCADPAPAVRPGAACGAGNTDELLYCDACSICGFCTGWVAGLGWAGLVWAGLGWFGPGWVCAWCALGGRRLRGQAGGHGAGVWVVVGRGV